MKKEKGRGRKNRRRKKSSQELHTREKKNFKREGVQSKKRGETLALAIFSSYLAEQLNTCCLPNPLHQLIPSRAPSFPEQTTSSCSRDRSNCTRSACCRVPSQATDGSNSCSLHPSSSPCCTGQPIASRAPSRVSLLHRVHCRAPSHCIELAQPSPAQPSALSSSLAGDQVPPSRCCAVPSFPECREFTAATCSLPLLSFPALPSSINHPRTTALSRHHPPRQRLPLVPDCSSPASHLLAAISWKPRAASNHPDHHLQPEHLRSPVVTCLGRQ